MDEVVKLMFSIASVWNAPLGENMLRVSPDIALLVANFPSIRGLEAWVNWLVEDRILVQCKHLL